MGYDISRFFVEPDENCQEAEKRTESEDTQISRSDTVNEPFNMKGSEMPTENATPAPMEPHEGKTCSICGKSIPHAFELNAFYYGAYDDHRANGTVEMPYSCFICGKSVCPDCAEEHGGSYGVFLACSKDCFEMLRRIEGIKNLHMLAVVNDHALDDDLAEGEYIRPFYWYQRCCRCHRPHVGECDECPV